MLTSHRENVHSEESVGGWNQSNVTLMWRRRRHLEINSDIFNIIQSSVKAERGVSVINEPLWWLIMSQLRTVTDNTKERVGGKNNTLFLLKSQEGRCLCFGGFPLLLWYKHTLQMSSEAGGGLLAESSRWYAHMRLRPHHPVCSD